METQEQLLDIRRAEIGLPPRVSRLEGASRPRAEFKEALPHVPDEGAAGSSDAEMESDSEQSLNEPVVRGGEEGA